MIDNKHISKIIIALMAVAVCTCIVLVIFSNRLTEFFGGTEIAMEYETKLFDTSEVMTVDIQMDADDWDQMLSNAMSEEYYVCDVVVNGQKVNNVGIRPKGNTSLSAIVSDPDTDRYSLKLEFDHYVDEQTCFGLDKLILNNNYADATNMKEAMIYDMFQYLGADASLYNYAKVSVNGEYWGIYLALEGVEDSFALRNYGTQDGELYKPESMGMGGEKDSDRGQNKDANMVPGNGREQGGNSFPGGMPDFGGDFNFNMEDFFGAGGGNFPQGFSASENSAPGAMPSFEGADFSLEGIADFAGGIFGGNGSDSSDRKGGFSMSNGGANLNYVDDDLESYSTIWEGAVTDTTNKDHRRVVTALQNISEGTDLEKYMDIDNLLKFMAVHTFAVNMDSLSGSMAHNYYLYENDGQLNMIPWDYNLSFGGMSMGGGSASDMINDAIDTPFAGTEFFDALLENEEYNSRYHAYLQQLVDEYVNGGRFDEVYQRIRSQIDDLVATDPNALYNEEEYNVAAEMLYKTIKLRAESIDGQLNGSIPSTDAGQRQDSSTLIDASEIDITAMGQFNMGGFMGGRSDEKQEEAGEEVEDDTSDTSADSSSEQSQDIPSGNQSEMPSGIPSGEFSEKPSGMPSGDFTERPSGFSPGDFAGNPAGDSTESTKEDGKSEAFSGKNGADNKIFANFPGAGGGAYSTKTGEGAMILGICFLTMILALVGVKMFRRK